MIKTLILVSVFCWAAEASAIVNIESIRIAGSEEGFSGEGEAAVGGSSGNSDKVGVSAGGRFQWKRDRVTDFAVFRYAYGESAGRRDTNNSFFHARHVHQRSSWRANEVYIQGETDEFSRLSFRALIGGGQRFTLLELPKTRAAYLNLGAFYAVEELDRAAGAADAGRDRFWRISAAFSYKHQLNEQVRFVSTTYYQPATDRFSDYRILEEAALGVRMSERLHLKLSLDIVHDSQPPQTVDKTDLVYSTGVEYAF